MLSMLIFQNLGKGCLYMMIPCMVDIDDVRQGVSCYRPSIQSRRVSVLVLPQF